jgi:hypothetical protein
MLETSLFAIHEYHIDTCSRGLRVRIGRTVVYSVEIKQDEVREGADLNGSTFRQPKLLGWQQRHPVDNLFKRKQAPVAAKMTQNPRERTP